MEDGEEDLRELARARLRKKRDFAAHLVSYVAVNALLIGIWAFTVSRSSTSFWNEARLRV